MTLWEKRKNELTTRTNPDEAARFSLIICTIGRVEELRRFLSHLQKQTFRDFEVLVADQNRDSRLAPLLAEFEDSFPILHLKLDSKGASRARNEGLRHAKGDIIAFPDDDCFYPPDLLGKVESFFSANPVEDGLTGRSTDENGHTSMGGFEAGAGVVDRINVWTRSIEYTIFLRRECVRDTWFDKEIGVGAGTPWGSGEGTDFLIRLIDRGASIHYDPDVTVFHLPAVPPYSRDNILKAYSYGCGMGLMLKRHGMPLSMKARWLYRPLGGAALALGGRNPRKARHHWATFKGRLRGMS